MYSRISKAVAQANLETKDYWYEASKMREENKAKQASKVAGQTMVSAEFASLVLHGRSPEAVTAAEKDLLAKAPATPMAVKNSARINQAAVAAASSACISATDDPCVVHVYAMPTPRSTLAHQMEYTIEISKHPNAASAIRPKGIGMKMEKSKSKKMFAKDSAECLHDSGNWEAPHCCMGLTVHLLRSVQRLRTKLSHDLSHGR